VHSEWNSIRELVEEFDLPCDASDLDCIKRALRTRLREIHPDRTPGAKFRDDEESALYHRLGEARGFVERESKKSAAIVKSSEFTGIIRDLQGALARMQKANAEVDSVRITQEVSDRSRSHYRRLRIGSGTFAAVVVATLTFMSRAKDYPFLGPLFQHPLTKILALFVHCLRRWAFSLDLVVGSERKGLGRAPRLGGGYSGHPLGCLSFCSVHTRAEPYKEGRGGCEVH